MNSTDLIHTYVPRISVRPEFYSGYGASSSNIGSRELELIYGGVKKECGDEAAKNFCQFIYNFGTLSPTAFLFSFHCWYGGGCEASVPVSRNKDQAGDRTGDNYDFGKTDEDRYALGMATIGAALMGRENADETESIRNEFLRNHKGEYQTHPDNDDLTGNWSNHVQKERSLPWHW